MSKIQVSALLRNTNINLLLHSVSSTLKYFQSINLVSVLCGSLVSSTPM